MFSLLLDCEPEEKDFLSAELWERGSAGIVELSDSRLRVFFEDSAGASALLQEFARYQARLEEQEPRDWVEVSRSGWEPIAVGSRFFLVPEWRQDPAPPGRFRIEINPGLACGTGYHEATQLCLEALEREVKPGMRVLDVGTGTGLLAHAARLLGAGRVWGCDVDPVAVEIAARRVPLVLTGTVDAVASESMDIIVANISAPAVIGMAPDVMRCLRRGGTAFLSGFERDELAAVEAAFHGSVRDIRFKNSWCLLEASR